MFETEEIEVNLDVFLKQLRRRGYGELHRRAALND